MDEVRFVVRRCDRNERNWILRVVEAIDDARRALVVAAERPQIPVLLNVLEDAGKLVVRLRDVTWPRVRGDNDCRNAQTQPSVSQLLPDAVVVEAAPIVPNDDDGRRAPIRALADRVDDACYPLGTGILA